MKHLEISASILAGDFSNLKDEIGKLEKGGISRVHFDIMDGHFVHNISFGPKILQTIRSLTTLPIDCHLMVSDPAIWIQELKNSGANTIIFHFESIYYHEGNSIITDIKSKKMKVGIAINPSTNIEQIYQWLPQLDLILIMSVNPGKCGQAFIQGSLQKIQRLAKYRQENNLNYKIMVDGGLNAENIPLIFNEDVDIAVTGSWFFKNFPDSGNQIKKWMLNSQKM